MVLPKHLAIIMDGNGRWADQRRQPRSFGHVKGTRIAKKIITECSRIGIKHLTLYAFSSENWMRPQSEVNLLMKLLRRYLKRETENLVRENIRFTIIGESDRLPEDVQEAIQTAIVATSKCTGLHLTFAISYGSRQEITKAVQQICSKLASGDISLGEVDEVMINSHLSTNPTPDPDLIIRTSGEKRLSNFLLWQAAYSEFYFTSVLWPDFKKDDLYEALRDYSKRHRRYGRVSENDENLFY